MCLASSRKSGAFSTELEKNYLAFVKRITNDAGIIIMLAYNHNCVLD